MPSFELHSTKNPKSIPHVGSVAHINDELIVASGYGDTSLAIFDLSVQDKSGSACLISRVFFKTLPHFSLVLTNPLTRIIWGFDTKHESICKFKYSANNLKIKLLQQYFVKHNGVGTIDLSTGTLYFPVLASDIVQCYAIAYLEQNNTSSWKVLNTKVAFVKKITAMVFHDNNNTLFVFDKSKMTVFTSSGTFCMSSKIESEFSSTMIVPNSDTLIASHRKEGCVTVWDIRGSQLLRHCDFKEKGASLVVLNPLSYAITFVDPISQTISSSELREENILEDDPTFNEHDFEEPHQASLLPPPSPPLSPLRKRLESEPSISCEFNVQDPIPKYHCNSYNTRNDSDGLSTCLSSLMTKSSPFSENDVWKQISYTLPNTDDYHTIQKSNSQDFMPVIYPPFAGMMFPGLEISSYSN